MVKVIKEKKKKKKKLSKYQKEILHEIYTNSSAAFSNASNIKREAAKRGLSIQTDQIEDWLSGVPSYTKHKKIYKNIKTRYILVPGHFIQMHSDLMDVNRFSQTNDGYKFILIAIDVFSRFLFAEPLLTKSGTHVAAALTKMIKRFPHPIQRIQSDKGKEYFNHHVQQVFKDNNINHFASESLYKANYAERVIKTLRKRMQRFFTHNNTHRWVEFLPRLVEAYNSTPHSSLPKRMSPKDVNLENQKRVWHHLYDHKIKQDWTVWMNKKSTKFKIGDSVRISLQKSPFTKDAYSQYSEEIFLVDKCFRGPPSYYKISDLDREPIKGRFYDKELVLAKLPKEFIVEEILSKKKLQGKTHYLIKWLGYPETMNSWQPEENLITL